MLLTAGAATRSPEPTATCEVERSDIELPGSLDENSGFAQGIRDTAVFWGHNDGGNDAVVIGFDASGDRVAGFELETRNRDWEDLAIGACPEGSCMYLADTGDNDEERDEVQLVRFVEPATDVTRIDPRRFDMRLPDGPRDIEAMYVLPGERFFFVTKGRNHELSLYRYPGPLREEVVELEKVQSWDRPATPLQWITGAGATRDGSTVVIRSYTALHFYTVQPDDSLQPIGAPVGLTGLNEPQGEAVGFGSDGLVYLTSEQGNRRRALMNVMRCTLDVP